MGHPFPTDKKYVAPCNMDPTKSMKTFRNDSLYAADKDYAASVDALCNMDPTQIILENVGRNFHGNYSCQVRGNYLYCMINLVIVLKKKKFIIVCIFQLL